MKILITGANGFVGLHLATELQAHGHEVCALTYGNPPLDNNHIADVREVSVVDTESVSSAFADMQPEACIHLAGMAFVPDSASDPSLVYTVNTMGTASVLEAVRKHTPGARVLTVTTSQVYGIIPQRHPISEESPLMPSSHYAISKAAADRMTLRYATEPGLDAMTARPHNHIGPGQSAKFVVPAFAAQLRAIADGNGDKSIRVGNLASKRDFADVRDVVRAYRLIIEKGKTGQAYNIGFGETVEIRLILEKLCKIAGVEASTEVDQSLYRGTNETPLLDTSRITTDTGWKPEIDLDTSLRDTYAAL